MKIYFVANSSELWKLRCGHKYPKFIANCSEMPMAYEYPQSITGVWNKGILVGDCVTYLVGSGGGQGENWIVFQYSQALKSHHM